MSFEGIRFRFRRRGTEKQQKGFRDKMSEPLCFLQQYLF